MTDIIETIKKAKRLNEFVYKEVIPMLAKQYDLEKDYVASMLAGAGFAALCTSGNNAEIKRTMDAILFMVKAHAKK